MEETKDDPDTADEELDMTSDKFNPLKAIYSKKMKVPYEKVQKFDNVSSFMARLKVAGNVLDADLEKVATHSKSKKVEKVEDGDDVDKEKFHVTAAGRKFLKDQGENRI